MIRFRRKFRSDEEGAVTADYTVIVAAIVGLGIASVSMVSNGVGDLGGFVGTQLEDMVDSGTSDYSDYALLHPGHDQSWRDVLQARLRTFNDNRLLRVYNNAYTMATSPDSSLRRRQNGVDRLGLIETEMNTRDLDVPEGNLTFEELFAEVSALS